LWTFSVGFLDAWLVFRSRTDKVFQTYVALWTCRSSRNADKRQCHNL